MPKVPQISAYLCNISRKAREMKSMFCLQVNTKVFYKLIVSLWVCIVRHVQSTQNNKFTISLQYLKEIIKDEVDFLSADKRQRFFKVILSLYACVWPGMAKLPKITSLLFLWNIFRKKWVMKLIFWMQISIKACYKLILWFWCEW